MSIRRARHGRNDSRVLGVCAQAAPDEVFRFEDACLIAGSPERMRTYLAANPRLRGSAMAVSKIRFADVHAGLDAGAAYAFDREAFERFSPLARDAGIDVAETFPESPDRENEAFSFVKVRLADPQAR